MSTMQPISRAHYANKRWRRPQGCSFAAHDLVVPLAAPELSRAAISLPIGFIADQQGFVPVALLGLQPGQNLFVAPDGRWLGGYQPARYRGYPFALLNTQDGQQVLCFDEDSGLLSDSEGEAFFAEDGEPAPAIKTLLDFLNQVQRGMQQSRALCAALQAQNLIVPWPLQVDHGQGPQSIEGLYRIDEAALNQLPAEAFETIRQAGVLPLVYCQLLSMQHLGVLGQLARAHAELAAKTRTAALDTLPVTPDGDLNLEFLNQDGVISFGPR